MLRLLALLQRRPSWTAAELAVELGVTDRCVRRDVARLRHIQRLSQDEGINLEGIRRILHLEERLEASHEQVTYLTEVIRQLQSPGLGARLFTAEAGGSVHLGRRRRRPSGPLAIETGR